MDWISVKDELPQTTARVIIWFGKQYGYRKWDTGCYHEALGEWADSNEQTCYPTHWARVTQP